MEQLPYEQKPKIYLGSTLDKIDSKTFEKMFQKEAVIKLTRIPILTSIKEVERLEKLQDEIDVQILPGPLITDLIIQEEVKPDVNIVSSNEVDLTWPNSTAVINSDKYFLRTRESKKCKVKIENDDTEEGEDNGSKSEPEFISENESESSSSSSDEEMYNFKGKKIKAKPKLTSKRPQVVRKNASIFYKNDQVDKSPSTNLLVEKDDQNQNKKSVSPAPPLVIKSESELKSKEQDLVKLSKVYIKLDPKETDEYINEIKNSRSRSKINKGLKYKGKFSCTKCNKKFSRPFLLRHHEGIHLDKKLRVRSEMCKICNKGFYNTQLLSQHRLFHHNPIDAGKSYVCEICGIKYEKIYLFKAHVWGHSNLQECEICHKLLQKGYDLNRHRNNVHLKSVIFECTKCSKKFSNKKGLESHNRNIHPTMDERTVFPCTFENCKRTYAQRSTLTNHIKNLHTAATVSNNEIPSSIMYKCKNCEKVYKSKAKLSLHAGQKHRDSRDQFYKCTIDSCTESYYRLYDLEKHQEYHSNPKPAKSYLCTRCPKIFFRADHLKNHEISHNEKKSLKCPTEGCDKTFKYPNHLRDHIRFYHTMNEEERKKYFKEVRERQAARKKKASQS